MGRDDRPTIEEIREGMNNGTIEWDGATYAFTGLESGLAEAKDPAEMLIALYRDGFLSPNRVIEDLASLTSGQVREWPGTINLPSC